MNSLNPILILLLLTISFVSCKQKPKNEVQNSTQSLKENKFENLEGFKWLNDSKNYQHPDYRDSFYFYFEKNLKYNKFENAAGFLMSFGNVLNKNTALDTNYLNTSIQFYQENSSKLSGEVRSNLCHYIGSQFHKKNDLERSFYWHNKCIEIQTESETHKQIQGFSHFSLGQNFSKQRILDSAEVHLVAALNIFEEVGDFKNQGTVYLLMFDLYVQNGAFKQAEEILNKALLIFKEQKSDFFLFSGLSFYIHYYIEQGDTLNTIKQINTLSDFSKTYTDITAYHKGILNQFLTFKYIAEKNKDSALHYLQIAKDITKKTGSFDLEMRTLFQEILYSNHFKTPLRNPEEVEQFYIELKNDNEDPNLQFMYQIATALFRFYQEQGDYEKANKCGQFLVEDAIRQSEERVKGRLFELERKFETEKKQKIILLKDKELVQKNKTIWLLGSASVFIMLILFLLIAWNKNRSMKKQKLLTEIFAAQLLQKTEDERKRIASDLHDSVSNELINLRHVIENSQGHLKLKIDNILEEVRNISRNISPTLFDKIGLKASVEQLTDRIQNQHNFFINSEIKYNGTLNSVQEIQLYRIVQEAITNILKHAEAVAGKVTIEEDDKIVRVEIKDNGKGFDVNKMLEKGNCFGLLNISERAKYINGNVVFHSNNNGTVINISIPK
ncbi:MAG TPA: ATP-binding protein [Edaphocola sp.]|nr:ATP-binding protein [Edaphocola sp.]